ncbi:MAG: hypothetical protein ABSG68_22610, partial [Thermoguttaceae bacterium]
MHFSQSGRDRDGRRRRLLADPSTSPGSAISAASATRTQIPAAHKSEHYGDAAFLHDLPRLDDLVPGSLLGFALLFMVGITIAVALEALHAWMPDLLPPHAAGRASAVWLGRSGTVGAWFSSLLLLAASIYALLVFAIRRHRTDDYHGRYRIWLWAALCWFAMAGGATLNLHDNVADFMSAVTGTRLVGDGSIWWAVPGLLVLGAITSRLVVDMLPARLSVAALVLAAGGYVATIVLAAHWLTLPVGDRAVMLE